MDPVALRVTEWPTEATATSGVSGRQKRMILGYEFSRSAMAGYVCFAFAVLSCSLLPCVRVDPALVGRFYRAHFHRKLAEIQVNQAIGNLDRDSIQRRASAEKDTSSANETTHVKPSQDAARRMQAKPDPLGK